MKGKSSGTIAIEVCVDSTASAIAAAVGGADRVELCQNLFEGGTTPSAGLIQQVRRSISCGLFVMIRPRGADFCYDEDEFAVMASDVETAKKLGADGIVLGLLRPDGRVDRKRTAGLVRLARPLSVTFHRAFDMTRDPVEALEDLIELGIERVLTSGQEKSVLEGSECIAKLVKQAGKRIGVMPGGGIHERNFVRIHRLCRAREYHFSGSGPVNSRMRFRQGRCFMGRELRPPEFSWKETIPARVQALRQLAGGSRRGAGKG